MFNSKLVGARVMFEGELYLVIDQREARLPDFSAIKETPIFWPTLLIEKVETSTRPGRKDKLIEVFLTQCKPMTSEIKLWLGNAFFHKYL